jgi:hypothetical protein
MTAKSHDPNKPSSPAGRERQAAADKPPVSAMPPAGPHAEPHLTNPDATPGTGSLTKTDHGEVETDPGGG